MEVSRKHRSQLGQVKRLTIECPMETSCWRLKFTNEWPESESLHLTRKPQQAKESQCFPAWLSHEDQLYVCQDEAVDCQWDLCPDNLPVGEGRNGSWPWHSLLLRRAWTSQRAGAHQMGQQPHGAADQRQGKAFADDIKLTHGSAFCDGPCWFWCRLVRWTWHFVAAFLDWRAGGN